MKFAEKAIVLLVVLGLIPGCKTISKMSAKGGTELIVQVQTEEPNKEEILRQVIRQTENRMDSFGTVGEVSEIAGKPDQISVKIYDAGNQKDAKQIERIKKLLFTNYQLELKKVISPPSPAPLQTYPTESAAAEKIGDNQEVLFYAERESSVPLFLIVEKQPIVTGSDVRTAGVIERGGTYSISFSLTPAGATKLGNWTGKNINNYLAVVLNKKVVSAAYIKSQIFDNGEISGRFAKEEADDIVLSLMSGRLPATLKILEEKTFEK